MIFCMGPKYSRVTRNRMGWTFSPPSACISRSLHCGITCNSERFSPNDPPTSFITGPLPSVIPKLFFSSLSFFCSALSHRLPMGTTKMWRFFPAEKINRRFKDFQSSLFLSFQSEETPWEQDEPIKGWVTLGSKKKITVKKRSSSGWKLNRNRIYVASTIQNLLWKGFSSQ